MPASSSSSSVKSSTAKRPPAASVPAAPVNLAVPSQSPQSAETYAPSGFKRRISPNSPKGGGSSISPNISVPDITIPTIESPEFVPVDMSMVDYLNQRLAEADAIAADPMSAPGVEDMITTIGAQLARSTEAAKGQYQGRLGATGGGAFAGVGGMAIADLEAQRADTLAQETANIFWDTYNAARQEGLDIAEALNAANLEVARIQNEQAGILADISKANAANQLQGSIAGADLSVEAQRAELDALMRQAALAEEMRQFNLGHELDIEELELQQKRLEQELLLEQARLAEQVRQFDLRYKQDQYEFDQTYGLQRDNLDLEQDRFTESQSQFDESFALDQQRQQYDYIIQQLQFGLISPDEAEELLRQIGVPMPAPTVSTSSSRSRY